MKSFKGTPEELSMRVVEQTGNELAEISHMLTEINIVLQELANELKDIVGFIKTRTEDLK